MDELKELIALFDKFRVENEDLSKLVSGSNSKSYKFFEKLREGEIEDNEEAASFLYGSPVNGAYKKLKNRLKKRLYNALLLIDLSSAEFSEYRQAYTSCLKYWAILQILLLQGKRTLAIPLAHRIYSKAKKFEFTDLTVLLSRVLRLHYGTITGNEKKYKLYNKEHTHYMALLSREMEAESAYIELAMNFVTTRSMDTQLSAKAAVIEERVTNLSGTQNSYNFHLMSFLVSSLRKQIENDLDGTIEVCNKAIEYFNNATQDSHIAVFTFLFKKLGCYIQNQDFERGEETAAECLLLVSNGSANWFFTRDYYLLLAFRSGKYQQALSIFFETVKTKEFKTLYQSQGENWKIYEAYIHFFIKTGRIEIKKSQLAELKRFKLSKFLNEVPIYSKDKRGMNISILVIQILFLLVLKKYDQVVDKIETINQYCYRYLRKDDTFRSNCFIKMLMQIPLANFHKAGVLRKSAKYHTKLIGAPLHLSNQPMEVEIIPYEILWEMTIGLLDTKFHYPRMKAIPSNRRSSYVSQS